MILRSYSTLDRVALARLLPGFKLGTRMNSEYTVVVTIPHQLLPRLWLVSKTTTSRHVRAAGRGRVPKHVVFALSGFAHDEDGSVWVLSGAFVSNTEPSHPGSAIQTPGPIAAYLKSPATPAHCPTSAPITA